MAMNNWFLVSVCYHVTDGRELINTAIIYDCSHPNKEVVVLSCILGLLEFDVEQDSTNPSWKLSFPHVLVATIVSFLFGYHLGFVPVCLVLLFCK